MKLLLVGANSSVGTELIRLLDENDIRWVAPEPDRIVPSDPLSTARVITQSGASQVVNLIAYGAGDQFAVEKAEADQAACDLLNHQFPEVVAQVCDHLHIPLIHLSTTFVFGGDKKLPYNEQDPPAPVGVYGTSALAGETAVRDTAKQHVIIRSGWLFGPEQDQKLAHWLKQLVDSEGQVTVARRKVAPTPVEDLARVILAVCKQVDCQADVWGTYHYAALDALRESELVQQLARCAAQHDETVYNLLEQMTINLVRNEPPYIANSALSSKRIFETFGIKPRPWLGSLERLVRGWYKVGRD